MKRVNNLLDKLSQEIDINNMDNLLKVYSNLDRLTGTEDAELSVDYIINNLEKYNIEFKRYTIDTYFSNPLSGKIEVREPIDYLIEGKARSFGGSCPNGIEGYIIFDNECDEKRSREELKRCFEGKIVLSWNYYEDYVYELNKCGALGLVHISKTSEDVISEETVGAVWGTPTIENADSLFEIPVVGIGKKAGLDLVEHIKNNDVKVKIFTSLENTVRKCSLPICEIKGRSDEYVLISGHYDSWHKGISDNAVGNAICLEIGRILQKNKYILDRSIKIAWWAGHSNGRYAGSTWFCDNFFEDILDNCIAHINIDSLGTRLGSEYIVRSAYTEGREMSKNIIYNAAGKYPRSYQNLPKGADMSFWGADIPFHMSLKCVNPELKEYIAPGSGGNWWWHTEDDTYDKADLDLMKESVNIILRMSVEIASSKILPFDYDYFFKDSVDTLVDIDVNSDIEFDFKDIILKLKSLYDKYKIFIESSVSNKAKNKVTKHVSGNLVRLKYSKCGRYEFDNTYTFGTFPGIRKVYGIFKRDISEKEFLFYKTYFIRQKNRFMIEIRNMIDMIGLK